MKNDIIASLTKGAKHMSEYQYKYNPKKAAYDVKYRAEHYDRIEARLPKGYREKIREYVDKNNTNINTFIKDLIDKELNL